MAETKIVYLRKLLGKSRRTDFLGNLQIVGFAEEKFRRSVGHALCLVVSGLVSFALLLNWHEGNSDMLLILSGVFMGVFCTLTWLQLNEDAVYGPPYLLLGVLALLGVELLLVKGAGVGSLFWFLIFPPMVMLCLGLKRGSIAFSIFFSFLVIVMLTPLQTRLVIAVNMPDRIRFLVAMMGAFAFSWCMEFLRFQTQYALGLTLARLKQDSLTDPLTGLGNRRDFQIHCQWILDSSGGKPTVCSLAIADIDHFKKINDTHGHDVGDKVIQYIGRILGNQVRETDKLYRWGGEEFLILMPWTTARDARLALERMRCKVKHSPYAEDGVEISFTISVGLYTGILLPDQTSQIAKADRNLYVAKESGRDKVVG